MKTKTPLAIFRSYMRSMQRFTCVKNTLHPELDGQERTIVRVRRNSFAWMPDMSAGKMSWTNYPKAREIVESHEVFGNGESVGWSVTFKMTNPWGKTVDDATLTFEFAGDYCVSEGCHVPTGTAAGAE